MRKNSFKRLSVLLAVFFFLAVLSTKLFILFAQTQADSQGLEVLPPSQEMTVNPGSTATITAKIRNRSQRILPISVRVEDFTASGEEGQVALTEKSPYSILGWTTVSPDSFTLGPAETKEVKATIKVPADSAGGRYGAFIFSVKGEPNQPGSVATLTQEVASLFLVKIPGAINEQLAIEQFRAPAFSEFGPVEFSLKFRNDGNVHVKTFGLVNVSDMFGRKVQDIVVTGTNVFPQASRVVHPALAKKWLAGTYTVTAVMYYGSTNRSLTAQTTFFAFPVRVAAAVLVIILILFLLRKRLQRAVKELLK